MDNIEYFLEELANATAIFGLIIMGLSILTWILMIKAFSDISIIRKLLKENNDTLTAMINEQRRISEQSQIGYFQESGQAQQMDSIET
jgi:hypothetical protein